MKKSLAAEIAQGLNTQTDHSLWEVVNSETNSLAAFNLSRSQAFELAATLNRKSGKIIYKSHRMRGGQ